MAISRIFDIVYKYITTIRFLKTIQVIYRVKRLFKKPKIKNIKYIDVKNIRKKSYEWTKVSLRNKSFFEPDKFLLLNQWGKINPDSWTDSNKSHLWQYNQNYFDDLNSDFDHSAIDVKLNLIDTWINTDKLKNSVGWEPYPTSIRIVNWIKFHFNHDRLGKIELQSLASQVDWLSQNIEWHILGNHLLVNAKALIFGGLLFEGKNAENWLKTGLYILTKELKEQFNFDGMHFEKSFMYHALLLEDLLDLINIFKVYDFEKYRRECELTASKAMGCLEAFCHPDGEIPFFNDATFGVAASKDNLLKYYHLLGLCSDSAFTKTKHIVSNGYVRSINSVAYLLCDIGDIGPNYIPSHAHADSLSFELSLFGNRLIVNSGISEYGQGVERLRQRGTRAHSTLLIDQKNSSDVWGGFRVAKRARTTILDVRDQGSVIKIEASHDGYRKVLSKTIHKRTWELGKKYLRLNDEVLGKGNKKIEINFHIHPSVYIQQIHKKKFSLQFPCGKICFFEGLSEFELSIKKNTFHPGFNRTVNNYLLQLNCDVNLPAAFDFELYWDY